MRFALTEEQQALRELARDVLADVSPLPRLRDAWTDPSRVGDVWRKLAEVGLTGIGIPEELGGTGGDDLDAALVVEAAGFAVVPEPVLETIGLVVPLVRDHAPEPLRRRWLPALAAGEATVAVRLGREPFAVGGTRADGFLVEVDGTLHLVDASQVRCRDVASEDPTRGLSVVEDVEVDADTALDGVDLTGAWLRGASATAAAGVGISARLLAMTVEHAKVREQFGTPIGSFQAVQQPLASVHVAVEAARSACWYAAHARAVGRADADDAARVAKVAGDEACALADRVALQVHAGIGFTWEHDLHLLLKRAAAWRAAYGDARTHRRALAAALFD